MCVGIYPLGECEGGVCLEGVEDGYQTDLYFSQARVWGYSLVEGDGMGRDMAEMEMGRGMSTYDEYPFRQKSWC